MDNKLINEVNNFKEEYYSENKKKILFKNSQKLDVANKISENFDFNQLLETTVFRLENTNHIMMDYTVFKLYANPNNYQKIIDYFLLVIDDCIRLYGTYTVHANIQGFTPTAANRYIGIIEQFNKTSVLRGCIQYTTVLEKWYVYNPPISLETIRPIIYRVFDANMFKNFHLVSREDSPNIWTQLLSQAKENQSVAQTI